MIQLDNDPMKFICNISSLFWIIKLTVGKMYYEKYPTFLIEKSFFRLLQRAASTNELEKSKTSDSNERPGNGVLLAIFQNLCLCSLFISDNIHW